MKLSIKILIFLVIILSFSGCEKQIINYPGGKDTIKLMGDGKFQLGKFPDYIKLQMFVTKSKFVILDSNVKKYKVMDRSLYVIGADETYTIINGKINTCKQCSPTQERLDTKDDSITYLDSYEDFTDLEKKTFEKLN